MATLEILNISGEPVEKADFADEIFASSVRPYLHTEVINWQRACRRAGTQDVLTKAEVSGSTKKPFPQKGRGMARQGSATKNPHQKGGGKAFAPKPRDYSFAMPKSKKRAALTSAISARVKEGRLKIVDKLELDSPKTKKIQGMLGSLGLNGCLVVDGDNNVLRLSARNHPDVKYIKADGLNVMDVLRFPALVMTVKAARNLEERLLA